MIAPRRRRWPGIRRLGGFLRISLAVASIARLGLGCGGRPMLQRPEAIFGGPSDDPSARAERLIAQLTLREKISQLETAAPAIPRLGIPAYDWWSEALHGVARDGSATVFPQVIGLAATFDADLMRRIGAAVADEARAKFAAIRGAEEGSGRYQGLTVFAPNVNLFRDPRWGRGQETFGEDPFLTARLAVAYVRGLQGDDPRRLKLAAVAKHFAVHSGPEGRRHAFDARVDAHDLADAYLPQFEALVREGHVAGIMAAYNRVNGRPCVTNSAWLGDLLRTDWGFRGFVVGDCGAIADVFTGHRVARDLTEAATLALRAGTDLDCGDTYRRLLGAVRAGVLDARVIDVALVRLFSVRFRLGLFDAAKAPEAPSVLAAIEAHRALAREAARKSIVLLRNDGVLPLAIDRLRRVAVIGPAADDRAVLLGNYHGEPLTSVTLRAGLTEALEARHVEVRFSRGSTFTSRAGAGDKVVEASLRDAESTARASDVVIACLGLSPRLESEEGDPESENRAGDRRDLALPAPQAALLRRLLVTGKPVIVVLTGGSAIVLPEGARPRAVVMAWYPGEEGGHGLADVLVGGESPSGRLPVTFYRDVRDLPAFDDYRMASRTYRYFAGEVAYRFGTGLGYLPGAPPERDVAATWAGPAAQEREGMGAREEDAEEEGQGGARVTVELDNVGDRPIERSLPVFAELGERRAGDPLRALVGFERVVLPAHTTAIPLTFDLPRSAFTRVDAEGRRQAAPGVWRLAVGDAKPVDLVVPSAKSTAPGP